MKSLFAFGLLLAAWSPAAGQIGSQHALGGSAAAAAQSHPLGGIGTGAGSGRRSGGYARPVYTAPYVYSIYVPNYFDSYGYDQSAAAPPPPQQVAPPPPPVIINQYFA